MQDSTFCRHQGKLWLAPLTLRKWALQKLTRCTQEVCDPKVCDGTKTRITNTVLWSPVSRVSLHQLDQRCACLPTHPPARPGTKTRIANTVCCGHPSPGSPCTSWTNVVPACLPACLPARPSVQDALPGSH
ncbi:hypothetical protein E2C01_040223 [Portunus trituberculatus]|uniref:Uncharacterized protein n=1 Tax=Portunus trituberculatus TaxID=210409 RepID=A0A5B7FN74_PORTR|nr:hypothetical protein [Portunus trituberculatus]